MLEELKRSVEQYQTKWQDLVETQSDESFLKALKPTAVAWKAEDLTDFDARAQELRDYADQIHFGWINERWLATFHLRDMELPGDITVIKLMQKRVGSTDATGLDHLDFLLPEGIDAKTVLKREATLKWSEEKNGEHCKWLSIWFSDTEAKLRSDTVLGVCADEMLDCEKLIMESST